MTHKDSPQAVSAERQRQAAARARAYRQRSREAALIDTAIADALAATVSTAFVEDGMVAFLAKFRSHAVGGMKAAGIESPQAALRDRLGLRSERDASSCELRMNR
ncbi:MAG: hypothetical protein K2Z25_19280 [Beijerinckiaceae bacterium]|nr:hypothetical protein [Beijerinckiaceae bacterium]